MIITRRGVEIDLSAEGKTGCPRCIKKGNDNNRDNLHVYGLDSEGNHRGAFCWACEYTIPSQEYLDEMEGDDEDDEEDISQMGSAFTKSVQQKLKETTGMDSKKYRGIRTDISKKFRVRYQYSEDDGSVETTLYPCTQDYGITGYKVRSHPKDFRSPGPIGETGKDCDMFGQFLFKTNTNMCIITGGEHDAMAAFQIMDDNKKSDKFQEIACVSPTIGESGAYKQVKNNYEFFNQFKRIIVCMDADEAGEKAAEKICKALPRGKAYIMKMRRKDPNTYIDERAENEFIQDFWAAAPYTPAGIHASTSLYEAAIGYSDMTQLSLPTFLKVAQEMYDGGLVKNEMTGVFAETSIGKSLFVDTMCVHWILHEPTEKVGVLSLEATKDKWSTNILSSYLGVKLIKLKGEDRKEYLRRPDVEAKIKPFLAHEDGSPRFYVMDERGADIEVIKEKILQMIIQLEVTLLVIDVYSDLLDGLSLAVQEELSAWFKKLLKEYTQVSIIMVLHTRKRASGHSGSLVEDDIIGTSTIKKSMAQTFSLERDKQAQNPLLRNMTFVRIHKNRHFSETGFAGIVYYEPSTGQLYDLEEYLEQNPELEEEFRAALAEEDF